MTDEITSTDETLNETASADEALELLKRKADTMGIKYGPRIGVDALRGKINAALNDEPGGDSDDEAEAKVETLTKAQREAKMRSEIQDESMKLIRVRIANMNPTKRDLQGEIFTVANRFIGTVCKFIPYGEATENGYHVPKVIYDQLKERKFLQVKTRTVNGQIVIDQRWVPEFSLEILDPLTEKELKTLAASQAAAAGMSE